MAVRKPAAKGAREGAEERLLVEAAQSDPAKFGDLYDIHFERIYVFIARRVRGRDKAEDLTSEVFHRALASLKSYEWRGTPFAAWLFRIAANAIADRIVAVMQGASNRPSTFLIYQYDVAGVSYEASQDVTYLRQFINLHSCRLGLPTSVRFDPQNPGNSIVLSERWMGLRQ